MRRSSSVLSLFAIILTAVFDLATSSGQTKITIGYAAVSRRTTPL
jgi:hypothetical protein